MNIAVLIGRLTRDPELRYIPSTGKAVANFAIAVDRPYTLISLFGENKLKIVPIILLKVD